MSNEMREPAVPTGGEAPPEQPADAVTKPPANGAGGESPGPELALAPAEAAAAALAERVAVLEAELRAAADEKLRAYAEMENMRKRSERERAETKKYAAARLAGDILSVGDNLQRAIAAVPPDAADPVLRSLLDGVTMTERELMAALERHGVRRMQAQGALFNPNHHQAVMELENPSVPAGTILTVFEAGYMIEDRVLRPATVVVARGGPKATAAPPAAEPAPAGPEATPRADPGPGDPAASDRA